MIDGVGAKGLLGRGSLVGVSLITSRYTHRVAFRYSRSNVVST